MMKLSFSQSNRGKAAALLSIGLLLPLCSRPARSDERANFMRSVVAKSGPGVITVSVVIKTSYSPEQSELETPGLVVDPSGLVVVTNMSIDPMASMGSLMGTEAAGVSTSVVSAKFLLADGSEVPAKLVLRDKDRNLAFLRPLHPLSSSLVALDFKGNTATAQLADPVLIVGRLGKTGGRAASITEERLTAVLQKPRTLYGLSYMMVTHLGEAAFTEKGELLGMVSLKVAKSKSSLRSMNVTDMMMPTIIPASDVWEVAVQAPAVNAVPSPAPTAKQPALRPAVKSGAKPIAKPTPKSAGK